MLKYNNKNNLNNLVDDTFSQKFNIANNLKNNLSYLIKKYNIDNETLAKCTGLANSTIASLRSRAGNPTILTLKPLADFFGVTLDQLINQDCSLLESVDENSKLNQNINIAIPIIDISRVAEWPFYIDFNIQDNPELYINTTNNINNMCFAVTLDSEVLAPYYKKNTVFIIDPYKSITDSNIVIVSIDNKSPTFRQVFIDGGVNYFKPINPDFGKMQLSQNYTVYGVVIRAVSEICI